MAAPSLLDDLDELCEARRVRMCLGQMPPHAHNGVEEFLRSLCEPSDCILGIDLREPQRKRIRTVDLLYVRLVEHKKRNRSGSGRFEEAWGDKSHVTESRPQEDRVDNG